jgi:Tfp pilus assembly protein PilE
MKNSKAFTLIELCTITAIIAILCAIAYPSYIHYLKISRRSDAHIELLKLAGVQEQFFLYSQQYSSLQNINLASGSDNYVTQQGYYRITATVTPSSYLLTATAIGLQASDSECQILTLAQNGFRDSTSHERCW